MTVMFAEPENNRIYLSKLLDQLAQLRAAGESADALTFAERIKALAVRLGFGAAGVTLRVEVGTRTDGSQYATISGRQGGN